MRPRQSLTRLLYSQTMLHTSLFDPTFAQEQISGESFYQSQAIQNPDIPVYDFGSREWSFEWWDTAGPEGFQMLRVLSYPATDVFVVCYSMVHLDSLRNVEFFVDEIHERMCNESKPFSIILCGCKYDLWVDDHISRSPERDYNLFKLRKKLEIIISIHIRIRVSNSQHRCSPVRRLLF